MLNLVEDQQKQQDMETERQQPQLSINKIEVKLPAFSVEDPEVFFALAEVSFQAAGVTGDMTKFLDVMVVLDNATRHKVRDVLLNLPTTDKYTTLKNALINRLVASQVQKTRRFLETEASGDRKPCEYLRHLQSLAGNTANDSILKSLWISRLPHQRQTILASQPNAELSQFAILADAINDTAPNYASVSGINESAKDIDLRTQVEELSRKFDEVVRLLKFSNTIGLTSASYQFMKPSMKIQPKCCCATCLTLLGVPFTRPEVFGDFKEPVRAGSAYIE